MRTLIVALCMLSAAASFAAEDLAGTWNVQVTETGTGTCQKNVGKVSAYVWIVSTTPDGLVQVTVQGETPFPWLEGRVEGDSLVLVGYSKRGDSTWMKLKVDGKELVGVRRFLTVQPQMTKKVGKVKAPCFLDLDVTGKKA